MTTRDPPLRHDPYMTIAGIFVFLLPLVIGWSFLNGAFNGWLSATPQADRRPLDVYANIWLLVSLALLVIETALIIFLVRATARRRAKRVVTTSE